MGVPRNRPERNGEERRGREMGVTLSSLGA